MVKNSRKHVNKLALKLLKVKIAVILMPKVNSEALEMSKVDSEVDSEAV